MKIRLLSSLVVIGAFMLMPQPSMADDLDDLKAAYMSYTKAENNGDVETFMDFWIDGGIFLYPGSVFPVVVNIARGKRTWSKYYETHTARKITYKPDYRVIGNTGLVWGHFQRVVRNKKNGKGERRFSQFSMTWVKSEGKWKVAAFNIRSIAQTIELL
jgi:ketosteroid isomerase-like protein